MDWTDLSPDSRGISPELGALLMVGIVVVLAIGAASVTMDFSDRLGEEQVQLDPDACPGFQQIQFETSGDDFTQLLTEMQSNNCALWLDAGDFQTDGDAVRLWNDRGPNSFDAVQRDDAHQPTVVEDSELDQPVAEFEADHSQLDEDADSHPSSGTTDGQYLTIDRDVSDFGLDEDSGFVIVALVKAETFDRNGIWTVGEAGVDGREFSMRTCSSYDFDGCEYDDPEGHWRGQHWGTADLDFSSGSESAGEWLVLTHAYNGAEVTIRVNGQQVASKSADLDLSSNRDIQIGRWERTDDDPHYYFDGRLAEMTIFDRTLADSELAAVEEYMGTRHGVALEGPIGST